MGWDEMQPASPMQLRLGVGRAALIDRWPTRGHGTIPGNLFAKEVAKDCKLSQTWSFATPVYPARFSLRRFPNLSPECHQKRLDAFGGVLCTGVRGARL